MKRKAFIVLFGAVLLLMATALTEYLFYRQDENTWVERFERFTGIGIVVFDPQ